MKYSARCAIIASLTILLAIIPAARSDALEPRSNFDSDLVLIVEQGRQLVSLRSSETDLINWESAVVPIPSVPDATHVDYADLSTTLNGEPYLAVNARFYRSYDEFGINEEGSTIGFGIYRYDRGARAWSAVLEQWDSGVNVNSINDVDSGRMMLQLFGYDYDEVSMQMNGWSVVNAAIWDVTTDAIDWAPAWMYGYSIVSPYFHTYMQTFNRGVDAFVLYDGLLIDHGWQYDGASWTTWNGQPAIANVARVWPIGEDEQWFSGNFGDGNWLAHRVGSAVSYSNVPGLCGLTWDPSNVQWSLVTTTNDRPFILITHRGYAWLNHSGTWQCRIVSGFPWEAHFLAARGPNNVVFEGSLQGETSMRLYYDHGGVLDIIDPPVGYETYTIRSAFWTH